jgi:multidrug efflux system membrane fusion protein
MLAAVLVAGCSGGGDDAKKKKRPPMLVSVSAAASEPYTPSLLALGTVVPQQSVAVKTRADGQIAAILFPEGDFVRAGQPLFKLDDRAARANLASARAQLATAQAQSAQATADYNRAKALVGSGFISGTTLDLKRAAAESGTAGVAAARAAIAAAETALSYLTITAPVSGRTGELNFKVGANVRTADTLPLVTVNQLSPITVRFAVPPEQIQQVRSAMASGNVTVAARAQTDDVNAPPIATGKLDFLDNNVDPNNGSVAAKARFDNRNAELWPGSLVNVQVPLGTAAQRVTLPEGAVQTGRDTPFVWLVGKDNKVSMRDVAIAGREGGRVYLASGIAPGDRVVIDSLTKLKPGDPVRTKAGPGADRRTATAPAVPSTAAGGA